MMRDMLAALEFLWGVGSNPYVYAPLLGLTLGLVFTQFAKFAFPGRVRKWTIRSVAILAAFSVVIYFTMDAIGLVLALIIGMLCPLTYMGLVFFIRKKWPKVCEALSREAV